MKILGSSHRPYKALSQLHNYMHTHDAKHTTNSRSNLQKLAGKHVQTLPWRLHFRKQHWVDTIDSDLGGMDCKSSGYNKCSTGSCLNRKWDQSDKCASLSEGKMWVSGVRRCRTTVTEIILSDCVPDEQKVRSSGTTSRTFEMWLSPIETDGSHTEMLKSSSTGTEWFCDYDYNVNQKLWPSDDQNNHLQENLGQFTPGGLLHRTIWKVILGHS